MANPPPYVREYDFSEWQESNPSRPLPAEDLDNELMNIETAINGTQTALADLRRSDGQLKNGVVTADSLADGLRDDLVDGAISDAQAAAATATTQAGIATTQAGIATTQAGTAADEAADAEAARDLAQAWAESDTAPAGGSTKSSKTHSEEAAAARDLSQQYASDAAVVSGVNVPIYASVASASSTAGPAGVKVIRTQAYAPVYTTPGTLRGGAEYIRVSKAVIDAAGYPALAYFRRTDRFMPDGTEDATNGGYWLINERRLDPTMFGGALDGATDDTAAAQACALMCCLTGREFCFPRGYLRLTEPLKFGRDVYTSLAWLKGLSEGRADTVAAAAAFSSTNLSYNDNNFFAPTIFVESNSAVIADFEATDEDPEAVIYYNFRATGKFFTYAIYGAPLIIGTPINIASGKFDSDADYGVIPDNGLIGIWFPGIQRCIIGTISPHKMGFSGVASFICYQADFQNIFAHHCGDGATMWEMNSGKVSVTANDCGRGLALYGDAISASLGTQQCRQDLVYFSGDNLVFHERYLEDYSPGATDGAGVAAIQLGRSGGGTGQVRNATIIGGRFGTLRPDKKSVLAYGVQNLTVIGTRFYSHVPEFDTNCYGALINTDLTAAQAPARGYFSIISQGSTRTMASHGLGVIAYEGAFRVSATGLSISVPAGAGFSASAVTRTVTLPAGTIPASAGVFDYQTVSGQIDLASGYTRILGRITGFNSATQVMTLEFRNPSASNVTIDQAFHVYFKLTSTGFLSLNA